MRPRFALAVAAVLLSAATSATPAHAAFGVASFAATVQDAQGQAVTQAGAHPYVGITSFSLNTTLLGPDGHVKDVRVDLPPGLISNPQATPRCSDAQFPSCPRETQVGTEQLTVAIGPVPLSLTVAVF